MKLEVGSPRAFLCEDPLVLTRPISMRGHPKLWQLPPQILSRAAACLQQPRQVMHTPVLLLYTGNCAGFGVALGVHQDLWPSAVADPLLGHMLPGATAADTAHSAAAQVLLLFLSCLMRCGASVICGQPEIGHTSELLSELLMQHSGFHRQCRWTIPVPAD